jgi:hypothetical protein
MAVRSSLPDPAVRPYAPVRFEYRIWGEAFPELPAPDRVPASAEVYLLPAAIDGLNAKIRGGALEIKRLLGVRAGLQEWLPALRCTLPLPAATIERELCPALGIAAPRPTRASYDLEPLLQLVASAGPGVRIVRLVKRRRPFEVAGARAERTRIEFGARTIESAAIEAEAFEAARRAVAELKLTRAPNLDYVVALRRLLAGQRLDGGAGVAEPSQPAFRR